jgi:autotransporter translocation and assembly factor TamB
LAAGTVLALAVGYAVLAGYLNSTAFRRTILQRVNGALDGRLTIQGHYLALHAMRLELHGVRLITPQDLPLAEIARLDMQLSWPALLKRTLHITSLTVDQVHVDLRYDPAGRLQLVAPKTSPRPADNHRAGAKPWALRMDDVRLTQGTVQFDRPAEKWSGQVAGLKLAARLDTRQPAGLVEISAAPVHWKQPGKSFSLPSLRLKATLDNHRLQTLFLQTPQSHIRATGRVDLNTAAPRINMTVDVKLNPEEFQAWFPESAKVTGLIHANLNARGPLDDPAVTVKANWNKARTMGMAIDQAQMRLRLHQHRITIDTLRGRGPMGMVGITGHIDLEPVFGEHLDLTNADWENITYALKLVGKEIRLDPIGMAAFPPQSRVHIQADMRGGGLVDDRAHGKAHITLQVTGLTPDHGAPAIDGRLTAQMTRQGPILALNHLKAAIDGNTLEGDARVNFSTNRIEQAAARLRWSSMETLGTWLGRRLPSGSGTVNLTCQGPFRQPSAALDLLARELAMGKHPVGRLLASAQLDRQGQLAVTRMVLENQGSRLEGKGRLSLFLPNGGIQSDPDLNVDLRFEQLAPEDFGWSQAAGSRLNGQIHLQGSLQHLTAEGELEDSAVQWGEFAGRIETHIHWDDGRLTIPNLHLFKASSSLRLKGDAVWRRHDDGTWSAEPQLQAQITSDQIQLQDFSPDYAGTVTLTAGISGPASGLSGVFTLNGTQLKAKGQPFTRLAMQGRLSQKKLHWDTLNLAVEKGQQLTSRGWYAFDRRFALNLAASDIDLTNLAALQQAYPISGRLNLDLKASGTLENPQMGARLTISDPRMNDQPWNDFHLTAGLQDHNLKLDADLNFNLSAEYQLDNGDINLQARFDQSDMTPYLAVWAGGDWAGVLSGRLQATGNRYQPKQIQGVLALDQAELRHQNRMVLSAEQLNARLENGRLELPPCRLALLQNGYVNLWAQGRWPADLEAASDGRIPLAALAPFVNALDSARGEVAFQAHTQGPLDAMQWRAKANLINTGFEIPGLNQSIENLNGRLELIPDRLVVEKLSGHLSGGRFALDGRLRLHTWKPVGGRLSLTAQSLPLQWPDTMDVVVNGNLLYTGSIESPRLSGRLVLLEGSYYKDVKLNLLSTFTKTRRTVPVPATYAVPEPMAGTALDVSVTHRYPLLVDNNLVNLEIAPDLKITGTPARPVLSGRAEVVQGEVIFRRKSFEVQRGVVDFINPYKIEPNLDIKAGAEIRQWEVSLSLSGTPDALVFKLGSNPPASENDILSLILLGRTGAELVNREGGGGGGQTTQQMLATLVATAWGEDVKKKSGIDILEVETGGQSDEADVDRLQVTVGKRLSRRLTLKYEMESGSQEVVQRAVSEYRFLEHLLASGFQASKGGYGGELVFRIEF